MGKEQTPAAASMQNQQQEARPRIAFITPRVFGTMGTQGSYALAKAFAARVSTLVISRQAGEADTLPIVAGDEGLAEHHRVKFKRADAAERIVRLVRDFDPDLVHFVNDPRWVELIPLLKQRCPRARFVLDLKTPLFSPPEKRVPLQRAGQAASAHLDLVVGLGREIVDSWIPDHDGPVLVYPLGIDMQGIRRRADPLQALPEKVRFVYVGQLHPVRQIPRLLQLVASLPEDLRQGFQLDLYGAGGGEEEIDEEIGRLGIADQVARRGALPQDALFELLADYDCGIAWVPHAIFNEAPSLKFLEYAAAGIGIIATDTLGHRRNVEDGFAANLFTDDAASFAQAVRHAMTGGISAQDLAANAATVERFGFDWIAEQILLPEYRKLCGLPPVAAFARAPAAAPARRRPRLLFVSPRPLGLMATPGTYLSVEAYADACDVEVVCKPVTEEDEVIVHQPLRPLPTTLLDPQDPGYVGQVRDVVRRFAPDIVCLGSCPGLQDLVRTLRQEFPRLTLVLEVKSPLVNRNAERRAREQQEWNGVQHLIDAVVAPSRGMAESYFGDLRCAFLEHRSIINYEAIARKSIDGERLPCRRFVFAGSLAKLRRIDKLLEALAGLPADLRGAMQVDVFGEGPVRPELEAMAVQLGLQDTVRFLGAVPQEELFRRYAEYDAGLAWVPRDQFDSAPSLKLIEYCAAGLHPVATASGGHQLLRKHGFRIDYFEEDDGAAFEQVIRQAVEQGVEAAPLQENSRLAQAFDYRSVIGKELLPFYQQLRAKQDQPASPAPATMALRPQDNPRSAWLKQVVRDAQRQPDQMQGAILYERVLHARRMETRKKAAK